MTMRAQARGDATAGLQGLMMETRAREVSETDWSNQYKHFTSSIKLRFRGTSYQFVTTLKRPVQVWQALGAGEAADSGSVN